jgi:hypothetical protein
MQFVRLFVRFDSVSSVVSIYSPRRSELSLTPHPILRSATHPSLCTPSSALRPILRSAPHSPLSTHSSLCTIPPVCRNHPRNRCYTAPACICIYIRRSTHQSRSVQPQSLSLSTCMRLRIRPFKLRFLTTRIPARAAMAVIVFMLLAQHPGADLHLRRRHGRLVGIAAAALALATTGIAFGLASYFGTLAKAARCTEQRVTARCRPVGALAACLGFGGAVSVRPRDGRGVGVCVFIDIGILGRGLPGATAAGERSRRSGGSVHGVLEFDDCLVQVGELAAGVRVHGDEGLGCGEEVAECRGCAGCIGRGGGAAGRCSDGGRGRSGRLFGAGGGRGARLFDTAAGRGGAGAFVRAFVGRG